jgi:hypothetical protein
MNGPHHYGTAEDLLDQAVKHRAADRPADADAATALAAVHATLALAAATAAPIANQHRSPGDAERDERLWTDVTDSGPRFLPPLPGPSAYFPYRGVPVR